MTQRTDKIDELLRQEIGQALEREVTDPGIGFVTITKVETSPDLSHARVWVSVIGSEERRREAIAGLRRAMPYIRRGLGAKIRLRRIPQLEVRLDDTLVRGTRVLQIISELEAGRTPEDVTAGQESLPTPVPRLPLEGDVEPEAKAPETASARKKRAWRPDRGLDKGASRGPDRGRAGAGARGGPNGQGDRERSKGGPKSRSGKPDSPRKPE
jgi:ribosome-binding factor A